MDATETNTEYRLRVDLPGFASQEVDIELQGDKLSVTANKAESGAGKARSVAFSRSFGLPDNIKQEDINASLDKGVLTVTLPKATPTVKTEPKTVPVQAGPAKPAAAAAEAGEAPAEGAAGSGQEQCSYRPWGRCRK